MDQNDWLTMPTFVCRQCGAFLVLSGQKRPVSEFYAIHPKTLCPLSEDVVSLDSKGQMIEKLVEKGVTLQRSSPK
jgi:hypothetical protein